MKKENIQEAYGKIGAQDDSFYIQFWQSQGEKAIFEAAMDMVKGKLKDNFISTGSK